MSLQRLLKGLQAEVKASLEELTAITTYDENLERQYKEGKFYPAGVYRPEEGTQLCM